jgi:hypothetical protein
MADLDWQPEFGLLDGLRDSYEKDFGRGTYRKEPDFTPGEGWRLPPSATAPPDARHAGGHTHASLRAGAKRRCRALLASLHQCPHFATVLPPHAPADDMILERVRGKVSALA